MRTAEGKPHLFVAIDRITKFAFVQLHERATTRIAGDFLRALIKAVPYRIHTVLTDNGTHFTAPRGPGSPVYDIKQTIAAGKVFRAHACDYACAQNDIDHRLTKPKHPWTNGQVERMNRTIKVATVKRLHYEAHDQLRAHLADFVNAYNFARRLKTPKGLTPYETIYQHWTKEPQRFIHNPLHQMPGLNASRGAPSARCGRGRNGGPGGARHPLFRLVQGKALPDFAKDIGAESWGHFFLKYVLGHPAVTAAIPGTTNAGHMSDDLGAMRGRLPDMAERKKMAAYFDSLR